MAPRTKKLPGTRKPLAVKVFICLAAIAESALGGSG